jgi:formate/nitrite transporter FocA (FNT family)
MLTLGDRRHLGPTARLWLVVIAGNLAGALLFALIATQSPALSPAAVSEITRLGHDAVAHSFAATFWSVVLAGWVLALVAWLVEATDAAIGRIVAVWALVLVVGIATLDHSIATAIEAWGAVMDGRTSFASALGWQATTLLGNALGGVFIVSVLNFGQVRSEN